MGFTKVRMGKGEIFTTVVEDQDGRELARWKVMKQDYPNVVKILTKQFGLNVKVIDKKPKTDLDWALN